MDSATRRRVCELVAGIIATDNELHPSELKFMLKTFSNFGVGQGEDDEALTPAVTSIEAAKAMAELPEEVRNEAISLLVASAAVDGKVVPAEIDFLKAVARAANIPEDTIDIRIAEGLLESPAEDD